MSLKFNSPVIDFQQNSHRYLSVVLPHAFIDNNSEVLVYGIKPGGYQREPEPKHYNKIKDYIVKTKDFMLPTSIVLAVDEEDLKKVSGKNNSEISIDFRKISSSKKVFRIVDGQHRIIAMRQATKYKPELKHFLFNVIILVTKRSKRSIEMEVFYDINSKGKRLKVDLIELARFNYRILEKSLKEKEINEHIAIQTAYYLNEKIQNSVWNNAIKFGIHDEHVIGIIGVNAFRESISGIVDAFLNINEKGKYRGLDGEKLILYSNEAARRISEFVHKAWDDTVKNKWKFCFKEGYTELDLFYEPKKVYYNPKTYIQRTMGAKSINSILSSVVNGDIGNNIAGLNAAALKFFDSLIHASDVNNDDWNVGVTFGGYSSESGFKKVSQIIMNTLSKPKLF